MKGNNASDKTNLRFIARRNMVLTGISWTQMQDALSFSFNFKEAMSSNLEIIDAKVDQSDPNLPPIIDLTAASLVGEIISSDDVIAMTVEVLRNLDLVNDATLNRCIQTGAVLMTASAVVAAAVVASILLVVAGVSSSVPIVGWIVAAACAVAAGICAVFSWIAADKRRQDIERYREMGKVFLIEDNMTDAEKDKIVQNFITFLAKVKQSVDDYLSDVSVFKIAKADRQENTMIVNGGYYVNQIEKNTDDLSYNIKTFYLGNKQVASMPRITGLNSFADCTDNSSSIYFNESDVTGSASSYRVYIVNRAGYMQEMLNEESTETKLLNMPTDVEKYEEEKEALLEYAFVISPYPLTNINDKVEEAIKLAIG